MNSETSRLTRRVLRKDAGESDLRRRSVILSSDLVQSVNDLEILGEVFFEPPR
jgi:hypothetical protein